MTAPATRAPCTLTTYEQAMLTVLLTADAAVTALHDLADAGEGSTREEEQEFGEDAAALARVIEGFTGSWEGSLPPRAALLLADRQGEAWAQLVLAHQSGQPVTAELRERVRQELRAVGIAVA
jgi:hypothetical protein